MGKPHHAPLLGLALVVANGSAFAAPFPTRDQFRLGYRRNGQTVREDIAVGFSPDVNFCIALGRPS